MRPTWSASTVRDVEDDDAEDGNEDDDDDEDDGRRMGMGTRLRLGAREARAEAVAACETFGGTVETGSTVDARAAVRRAVRALGDGDAARAEETLARLTRGCDECARRAVLPKRRDEVVDAWRRVAACGDAFERAMRPECAEAVLEMTEDGARALETAKRNADAATAYFEAVACVYGVENARALSAHERLASVNAFECADKALVFGVMDVFQGLATSARGEETRASLEASGALRDFIARSLITATAQESESSLDKPMAKRFFAFLVEVLRAKDERFAALAFGGVRAASAPVVSRLCLSLAGSDLSAAALYQEIKRLENGRVA